MNFPFSLIVIVLGYLVTFIAGSYIIRWIVFKLDPKLEEIDKNILTVGTITGLCESFIVITLVLFDEFSAIGLVVMA